MLCASMEEALTVVTVLILVAIGVSLDEQQMHQV